MENTQEKATIQITFTGNGYLIASSITPNKHSPHSNWFSAIAYATGYAAALHDIGYERVDVTGNR